ncbi:hypothetical protein ASG07_15850 [Sphingomonas sp. Leaf343]|nr:hypothetical protein ASG07_15850 [Sphingomonas sp. Leaf343]
MASCYGDGIGLSVTDGIAHFPGFGKERIVPLDTLDRDRVDALLAAADEASFFTRIGSDDAPVRPDARTWHIRLCYEGRSRLLAFPEPLVEPALLALVRVVRDCCFARRTMSVEEDRGVIDPDIPARRHILDALDMPGAGEIEIDLDRPVSHPRAATFD